MRPSLHLQPVLRLCPALTLGVPRGQGRLLEELPRELCEYLKVSAVVRSSAAALGGTIFDRLRINAVYALQARLPLTRSGLLVSWACLEGFVHRRRSAIFAFVQSRCACAWVACRPRVLLASGVFKKCRGELVGAWHAGLGGRALPGRPRGVRGAAALPRRAPARHGAGLRYAHAVLARVHHQRIVGRPP